MSELSVKVAAEHKRVWNRLNITCLCGWDTTVPPLGDSRPFIAHIADVTEAAVRETIAAEIEADMNHNAVRNATLATAARIARGER